MTLVP